MANSARRVMVKTLVKKVYSAEEYVLLFGIIC
jgi:ribosomal protein S20